jgi:hypothetical protein
MDWEHQQYRPDLRYRTDLTPQRKEWYDCSCCPMNIARLIASLGQYLYGQTDDALYVHLYAQSTAELTVGGRQVMVSQSTAYPWKGDVTLTVTADGPGVWTLALRRPGWCRDMQATVNGREVAVEPLLRDGYVLLRRTWQSGDIVTLSLAMPVERLRAHPLVRETVGKVALQRGPVVYCFEEADNGKALFDLVLPGEAALQVDWDAELAGGVVTIGGEGLRDSVSSWGDVLYRPDAPATEPARLVAVPYFAWANRAPGEMAVWIRER